MRHAPLAGGCEDLWAVPVSCRSSRPAAHEIDTNPLAGSIHTWHGIASHLSVSCTAMHGVPCVRCVLFAMRHALGMTMFKTKSAPAVCRLLQVLGAAPAGAPHDACNGGPRAQAG